MFSTFSPSVPKMKLFSLFFSQKNSSLAQHTVAPSRIYHQPSVLQHQVRYITSLALCSTKSDNFIISLAQRTVAPSRIILLYHQPSVLKTLALQRHSLLVQLTDDVLSHLSLEKNRSLAQRIIAQRSVVLGKNFNQPSVLESSTISVLCELIKIIRHLGAGETVKRVFLRTVFQHTLPSLYN